jgi:hypothetical protein
MRVKINRSRERERPGGSGRRRVEEDGGGKKNGRRRMNIVVIGVVEELLVKLRDEVLEHGQTFHAMMIPLSFSFSKHHTR